MFPNRPIFFQLTHILHPIHIILGSGGPNNFCLLCHKNHIESENTKPTQTTTTFFSHRLDIRNDPQNTIIENIQTKKSHIQQHLRIPRTTTPRNKKIPTIHRKIKNHNQSIFKWNLNFSTESTKKRKSQQRSRSIKTSQHFSESIII